MCILPKPEEASFPAHQAVPDHPCAARDRRPVVATEPRVRATEDSVRPREGSSGHARVYVRIKPLWPAPV